MIGLESQLVTALRQIVRGVDLQSKRLTDDFGLTGPQLATLQAARQLGSAAPSAIARQVHLSQATVTGILHRLEQRGLIAREKSTIDRRAVIISITAEGGRILEQAPSLLQDQFRAQLEQLEPWERLQILSTLQRVAGMMNAPAGNVGNASTAVETMPERTDTQTLTDDAESMV